MALRAIESDSDVPDVTGGAAVAAVSAQTILLFALTTLPTPLYRDYAARFHFGELTLTLIYATYVVGTLTTLLLLGRLSDQVGRRVVSLTAIACAGLAAILFTLAESATLLFSARLVTGVAAGLSSGTAVAWLRELHAKKDAKRATLTSVAVNIFGLGLGPLLCGALAELGMAPLVLPYAVYAAALVALALVVAATHETVEKPRALAQASFKPRLGVPRGKRLQFLAPGVTTFVIYSLTGFYSAIAPNLIATTLHLTGHAVTGAIVSELFLVAVVAALATARLSSRTVMLWGAGAMLPALALLVLAQLGASLPALLAGTAFGGISLGLGWRGALEVTSGLAPQDKRGEVLSVLFVCGNLGMALPVVGIGVLASLSTPQTANLVFAGVIALLSVAGVAFGFMARSGREA